MIQEQEKVHPKMIGLGELNLYSVQNHIKCVQTLPSSVITISKWLQTFRLLTVTQICSFNLVYNKPKTNFGLLFH